MSAQRPRLTTPAPLLQGSGALHIVGTSEVVTVPDPTGAMQQLLRLADGSRTRDEIFAALTTRFALLGEQEFEHALRELEKAGVLEEGTPHSPRPPGPIARRDAHARALFRGSARVL